MFLIGAKYRNILHEPLERHQVNVQWLPDNPAVDDRLSGHADLMIYAGKNSIVLSHHLYKLYNSYIINNCTALTVYECEKPQSALYPEDCSLCVRSTGRYDFYNPEIIDPTVKKLLSGIPIRINQGYAACSICALNENTIITSDNGIAQAAYKIGMNVLQIQPGHIGLDGFDYGFIGGASFKLDDCRMAFTGVLDDHPDKAAVLRFLQDFHIKPVYLTQMPVFDIGGAVKLP